MSIDTLVSESLSYGLHELQKILVYPVQNDIKLNDPSRYWVIYIHGGAWRDPRILEDSFRHTAQELKAQTVIQDRVTALASIGYRLSPHPNFPQDATNTPNEQLRNAKHPEHLNDVKTALALLQERYGFGDRYVLVGHSCGATLAFQTVMEDENELNASSISFAKPLAIAGVCGIYHLRLLRDESPACDEFLKGAFGPDESLWDRLSPAAGLSASRLLAGWRQGRLAALFRASRDSLIPVNQASQMQHVLELWRDDYRGPEAVSRDLIVSACLHADHDEVWEDGKRLAHAIVITITALLATTEPTGPYQRPELKE